MNPKLILAVALALLLLVSAPAQGQTPTAAFTFNPEAPAPGQDVQFQATTGGGASHMWDLDDDGAFDDAEGPRAKRAFAAGTHVVRLRARFPGGAESIATREIQVGAATPAETPTVTPTATPTETATPAPSTNQPPVAVIDKDCHVGGVCSGLFAREEQPHTLDGRPSHDPDGQIVKYEWTVDRTTLQAGPTLTHTFTRHQLVDDGTRNVRLKVTDDAGATAETEITLRLLEPQCESTVQLGRLKATGVCLRRRQQHWTSKDPITLNGMTITPHANRTITIAKDRVSANGASVTFTAKGAPVTLLDGTFSWPLTDGIHFTNVKPTGRLNGLKITGATVELNADKTSAKVGMRVALPQQFGAPTSDEPIVATPGKTTASAASEPLHFGVANAKIGPIGLDHLDVAFDGEDLWAISAGVALPEPIAAKIEGDAGIRDGGFEHAGASLTFPSPGIGPLGPIFLQRIAFRVELHPKQSKCVGKTGIEVVNQRELLHDITGRWFDLPNLEIDHGIPTFALCGEVGLTAGPTVLGAAAIRLDAGLGVATYDDRPTVFRAYGDVALVEIPLAKAEMEVHTNGYTRMHARFDWGIEDLATLKGGMQFEMRVPKFNATAYVDACLEFVDWCAGAKALVSSKGVAVCLKIDLLVDDWHPGFGYAWGDPVPTLYFAGCDVGPYKEHIRSGIEGHIRAIPASLQEQTIDFPAGLPGATIVAQGQSLPPKLTLIGPKGERITTPDDLRPVEQSPFLIIKDPRAHLTQFAISKPSAGRWRVLVEPGSAPLISLKSAEGLKPPKIDAKVSGRGQNRTLTYETDQKVTFIERGPSAGNTLGTVTGKGALKFHPAPGAAEKRAIVAVVEGRGEYEVARYSAPKAPRPGRTRGLKVAHTGSRLKLSWSDRGTHEATIKLSDGRRIVKRTRKRALTLSHVSRATTGTATVKATFASGVSGAPARKRIGRGS
jgi:hypothetical protein